jgi:hypothetical protein
MRLKSIPTIDSAGSVVIVLACEQSIMDLDHPAQIPFPGICPTPGTISDHQEGRPAISNRQSVTVRSLDHSRIGAIEWVVMEFTGLPAFDGTCHFIAAMHFHSSFLMPFFLLS